MRKISRARLLFSGIGIALFVMGLSPVGAASANISHSYSAKSAITSGSLVSLDPLRPNFVVLANSSNGQKLIGVAVAENDSLLAVYNSSGTDTVQVATSGTANTLVSSLNGAIKVGDKVSVSPFNGVGMKASAGLQIIGLAQTSFDESTVGGAAEKVTDKNGKVSQIRVGYIKLSIAIGNDSTGENQLNAIQRLAQSISGHKVSTTRAIFGFLVAIVASVGIVVLIYASIYGGIISIGRNPLAKYAVFRSMASVFGMAGLIALVASLTVFLLLR